MHDLRDPGGKINNLLNVKKIAESANLEGMWLAGCSKGKGQHPIQAMTPLYWRLLSYL